MDLIPSPGQVVSAAGNVLHALAHGGVADLRPVPSKVVDSGELHRVHHYRTPGARAADAAGRDPVLLVAPLAAPALCYDLRRGGSLVEHLVDGGRPTYLVDYGDVSVRDRGLTLEPWVREVLPAAVRATSEHAGGHPVHLVGWSLGGALALLAAADRPELPIGSVGVLGTPFDVRRVPVVAPARGLLDLAAVGAVGGTVERLYRAAGGPRLPVVGWTAGLEVVQRLVNRPLALAQHLDDAEFLAQVEAVDRFVEQTSAYRGRTYGQLYHRFLTADAFTDGRQQVGEHVVDLADVTAPVLLVAGLRDEISPVAAVQAGVPLLPGPAEVRFEMVDGGHLGLLTGRDARHNTWPVLDEWLADHDGQG